MGIGKRQRAQQHAAHDAEDRGGGANAQRERADCAMEKAGLLRKVRKANRMS